jgi:hypothetical protein
MKNPSITIWRHLLATVVLCGSLFVAVQIGTAQDNKWEESDYGFWFEKKFDPLIFDKAKFKEDKRKEIQDYLKKISDEKTKLCKTVWNKKGPAKGHDWTFTCKGECNEKSHCEIRVIYQGSPAAETLNKFKIVEGKDGSVTAAPNEFREHVLLVYCECKKNAQ